MAKKGDGEEKQKGSFWDNPFGGAFDFNHDGKEDAGEQWLGLTFLEGHSKEEKESRRSSQEDSFLYSDDGEEYGEDGEEYDDDGDFDEGYDKGFSTNYGHSFSVSWRDFCADGSEYDLDPDDYRTEREYNKALARTKAEYAWRKTCEDGSEYGLDPNDFDDEDDYMDALEEVREAELDGSASFDRPEEIKKEDFPNKRRYDAALELAELLAYGSKSDYEKKRESLCRFILDQADTVPAANYLSCQNGFLYAQAIKDHFSLPISLPDEDEDRQYGFSEAICKIAKRSTALAFEVWEWGLETFLPYAQYSDDSLSELTSDVIGDLCRLPDRFQTELVRYMDGHPEFLKTVMDEKAEVSSQLDVLIAAALGDGLEDTALALFQGGLTQAGGQWKRINPLVQDTISRCQNYRELESAECFKLKLFPLVRKIDNGMVQDEIEEWEQNLDEYIDHMENSCERYTYTRKNAWRKTAPDGAPYGLDPRYYSSEQEYLEALDHEKYGWREWYKNTDTLGLDVNSFETQKEYLEAYEGRWSEKYKKEQKEKEEEEREQRRREWEQEKEERRRQRRLEIEKALSDERIYTLCGVAFSDMMYPYYYRTEDTDIKIGDTVLVQTKEGERACKVVSVGQYLRLAAPFPFDKIKSILRRIEGNENW